MPDVQLQASAYLAPSVDSIWRWSADGEVLTWADGRTIAFAAEVRTVLARLAPQGLPPFGAVVLLLAACREGWAESSGRELVNGYGRVFHQWQTSALGNLPPSASQFIFHRVAREIGQILAGLDVVGRLPAGLREGVEAKAVLARTVFETARNRLSTVNSNAVVEALGEGVHPDALLPRLTHVETLSTFAGEAEALSPGIAGVSEESLALRVRTGLDQLVGPADPGIAPSERVRRLLAELRSDPELSGLARLALDLMAAVHVPRTLHVRDEMPLGGVSDLSNRGPLDRLLTSELAHDDLTLAVRVAVNEALYLRRESPPKPPPSRRAILIDTGIRLWGVPRVFAAASALALAATTDAKAALVVYRASERGVEAVDLTSRPGLIELLTALEPAPHPGRSLAPFFDAIRRRDAGDEQTDAVLITHPDVLSDAGFTAVLSAVDEPAMYVATVARDGAFRLMSLTAAGRKPVRDAKLSLAAILGAPSPGRRAAPARPPGVPLLAPERDPSLPVILSVEPFPLLLPYVANPKHAAVSERHGLVAATRDGRLLHWASGNRAARQVTALLPRGTPRLVSIDDDSGRVSLVFQRRAGPMLLVTADLVSGHCGQVELESSDPGRQRQGLCVHNGALLAFFGAALDTFDPTVDAFDLATGRCVAHAVTRPEHASWRSGRFLFAHRGWFAAAYDGSTVRFEPVPVPLTPASVVTLFDRHGHDGPWGLLRDGRLLEPTGNIQPPARPTLVSVEQFLAVSPDGSRLLVQAGQPHLLDLEGDAGWRPVAGNALEAMLAPQMYWSTRYGLQVRTKFRGIVVQRDEIMLVTRAGMTARFARGRGGRRELQIGGRIDPSTVPVVPFERCERAPGTRFDLSVATFADGSRAFLDSRGLLHLKSADPSVPEVSLVLATELAGWSSEGKVFGPAALLGDATPTDSWHFVKLIESFTTKLRPPDAEVRR